MSKARPPPMDFKEFCKEFNSDPAYRDLYKQNPAALIERDLGIRLTQEQKADLIEKVQAVLKKVPDFRLCVAGEPYIPDPDVMVQ
jgi:hypothetical protein